MRNFESKGIINIEQEHKQWFKKIQKPKPKLTL